MRDALGMRVFRDRKFHTSPLLIEMFALRASGFTVDQLAQRFDRDISTIRHHLRKHAIKPMYVEIWHPKGVKRKKKEIDLGFEKVNQGHMYAEYIRMSKERKFRI